MVVQRRDNRQRTVLHVSALPFWTVDAGTAAGMPSIRKAVEYFVARGWRSVFLYPTSKRERPRTHLGVRLLPVRIPLKNYGSGGFLLRQQTRLYPVAFLLFFPVFVFRIARALRPDLIYCHGALAVFPGWLIGRTIRLPVVARLYGFAFPDVLLGNGRNTWKSRYWAFPEWLALKLRVDAYVVTHDGTHGKEVVAKYGLEDRSLVVLNGVDPLPFSSEEVCTLRSELTQGRFTRVVTYVGRLDYWKRCDRILSAARLAHQNGYPWLFLLVGDGPHRAPLEATAKAEGLGETFRILGSVPHDSVWKYLLASDVFVALHDLSSLSNTLLEALAVGLPVVVSDKGTGLNELVLDCGANACLVKDPDNPYSVLAAIEEVLRRGRTQLAGGIPTWDQRLAREWEFLTARCCLWR